MLKKDELPFCPVATTIDLIGNKWKLLIIRELLTGAKRFNELHRTVDGISKKILAENLKQMELDGLIVRKSYDVRPLKVEYFLSSLGDSLRSIIDVLGEWGVAYLARNHTKK